MANNRGVRKAVQDAEPTDATVVPVVEVSAQDARNGLAELLNRAEYRGERIKIVRHGKAVAVLLGLSDYERLNEAA